MFARPSVLDKTTSANDSLNILASSINEWNHLTEELKAMDSFDLAREVLGKNRAAQSIIKQFEANAPHFYLDYSPSRLPRHIRAKWEEAAESPGSTNFINTTSQKQSPPKGKGAGRVW